METTLLNSKFSCSQSATLQRTFDGEHSVLHVAHDPKVGAVRTPIIAAAEGGYVQRIAQQGGRLIIVLRRYAENAEGELRPSTGNARLNAVRRRHRQRFCRGERLRGRSRRVVSDVRSPKNTKQQRIGLTTLGSFFVAKALIVRLQDA